MLCRLKSYARRTMELANNYTFSSINNKTTLWSNERNLTHKNPLLLSPFFIFQLKDNMQRRSICLTIVNALQPIQFRRTNFIMIISENDFLIITFNWKNFIKHSLQAGVFSFRRANFRLKKFMIRIYLNFNQVRGSNDFFNLAKVNTLF